MKNDVFCIIFQYSYNTICIPGNTGGNQANELNNSPPKGETSNKGPSAKPVVKGRYCYE